ncbi:MAG: hypothetical protein N4A33_10355 [Bacteriovoracaceae bacterium]|jgi:hypothetical protein|nr:hypothetical protein [Bacteriovoracaceae bacterium]
MKTTHIGSLPFKSKKDAIDFSFNFDLPVLASLPYLDENEFMHLQLCNGQSIIYENNKLKLKSRELSAYKIPICLKGQFYKKLGKMIYKWQVIGPLTFLSIFEHRLDTNTISILLKYYVESINISINKKSNCYLFLDEPLYGISKEYDYKLFEAIIAILKKDFYKLGIHCCSNEPLDKVKGYFDGLSFDYEHHKHILQKYSDKELFFGIWNTKSSNIYQSVDLKGLNGFITPSCGLALNDINSIKQIPLALASWSK